MGFCRTPRLSSPVKIYPKATHDHDPNSSLLEDPQHKHDHANVNDREKVKKDHDHDALGQKTDVETGCEKKSDATPEPFYWEPLFDITEKWGVHPKALENAVRVWGIHAVRRAINFTVEYKPARSKGAYLFGVLRNKVSGKEMYERRRN